MIGAVLGIIGQLLFDYPPGLASVTGPKPFYLVKYGALIGASYAVFAYVRTLRE